MTNENGFKQKPKSFLKKKTSFPKFCQNMFCLIFSFHAFVTLCKKSGKIQRVDFS